MARQPFMDCKSRKRRKRKMYCIKPKYQGYCPHSMVRYDNSVNIPTPVWVCKLCLKCLLSEKAVHDHLLICTTKKQKQPEPSSTFDNVIEKTRYKCKYCNRDFSRQVSLKKHEEAHEKPKIKQEWESESESDSQPTYW